MRLATRAVLTLVLLGFVVAGALLLAAAAIGPREQRAAATDLAGAGRPAVDSWRTDDSVADGIPVAFGLSDDFARAWIDMVGLHWYHLVAPVVVLVVAIVLVRRLFRRHAKDPLPV